MIWRAYPSHWVHIPIKWCWYLIKYLSYWITTAILIPLLHQTIRMDLRSMPVQELYSRLVPLVLLCIKGSIIMLFILLNILYSCMQFYRLWILWYNTTDKIICFRWPPYRDHWSCRGVIFHGWNEIWRVRGNQCQITWVHIYLPCLPLSWLFAFEDRPGSIS